MSDVFEDSVFDYFERQRWFACGHPRLPGQVGLRCMYPGRLTAFVGRRCVSEGLPACTNEMSPECARTCATCGRHLCPTHVVQIEGQVACPDCANNWQYAQEERQSEYRLAQEQAHIDALLRPLIEEVERAAEP